MNGMFLYVEYVSSELCAATCRRVCSQIFYHHKFDEANTLAKVFDVDSTSTNVKYAGKRHNHSYPFILFVQTIMLTE